MLQKLPMDHSAHSSSVDRLTANDPLDGGYGWVCVAACFSINCFTWGVVAAYGVYLSHYLSENLFPDAIAIDFALMGGFNYSMAMLVAPFVTILSPRYGIKAPMIIGVALLAAAHIFASVSSRIWQLYLSQGILLGFGVGFTYIPSIAILSQWFQKRRSLANGISGAGSGIGVLLFSFATESAITDLSLAWSFRLTAIISIVILLPSALLLRSRNEVVRPFQRGFDAGLLRRYDVQMLLAWSFVVMFGFITLLFSLPDFARSIGLSNSQAATISALLDLGIATGWPLIGIISDRYGRIETAGVITFICGILCFVLWLPGTSYATIILFSLLNGAVFGVFWVVSKLSVSGLTRTLIWAYWQTIGPLCVEVAGLVELPSLLSLSWITITLPTSFSEIIALKLRRTGSGREYLYPQIFAGLAYICASACIYELRRIKRAQAKV